MTINPAAQAAEALRARLAGNTPAAPLARQDAGQQAMIAQAVANGIAAALGGLKLGVDEDAVRALIDDRLAQLEPVRLVITPLGEVKIEQQQHPLFEKVLRLVAAGVNVMLVGPAGCGKSHMVGSIAKALQRRQATLHMTAGTSEAHMSGWLLPIGDGGKFAFCPAEFATLYEAGNSLLFVDEVDNSDPNTLGFLNGAIANGELHIPQALEKPLWKRGANVSIVAAANTYGTGADTMYVGRNQLDAATLDRFYVVSMDYDLRLEAAIAGVSPPQPQYTWTKRAVTPAGEWDQLARWVWDIRQMAQDKRLRRVISTRTMQKAKAAYMAGLRVDEIKADLLAGWTADEKTKVGERV